MSETTLTTVWELYDPERHAAKGGNYMFLLKSFGNAPYYSGETQDFADRFRSHSDLFAAGGRTFMRRPFFDDSTDRSHAGFAERWAHYKQQDAEEQERLVWVPKGNDDDNQMAQEGKTFWANEVRLLVSIRKEDRRAVEGAIQNDIGSYYNSLSGKLIDWSLPIRARLMGQNPGGVTKPMLAYQLIGEQPQGPHEFFGKLQELKA